MRKVYAGIGSRETPGNLCDDNSPLGKCKLYSKLLARYNYVLRSGAANGADNAFESGCDAENGSKEIFLPWEGFNKSNSVLFNIPDNAFIIAKDIYGDRWKYCNDNVKKLMARTIMQIVGVTLNDPCGFVICWTKDGCSTRSARTPQTGGTGQAIAYADSLNIPVYNLANPISEMLFLDFIDNIMV